MTTEYEWTVELIEDYRDGCTDIVDSNHFGTYAEAKRHADSSPPPINHYYDIGIVRKKYADDGDCFSICWAYIADGKLPPFFEDAYGHVGLKVPARFQAEIDAA